VDVEVGDDLQRHDASRRPRHRDTVPGMVMASRALRGTGTGIPSATSDRSLTAGTVEDLAAGSSQTSKSMPPRGFAPNMLACRSASVARSSPGPLPYQTPTTPPWLADPIGSSG
jgi:hypothetical protein